MSGLTRRSLGGVVAGALAAAATAPAGAAVARKASFVLVHGAWHGGRVWERLVPLLSAQGHRVYVPTLSGQGERVHLLSPGINLDTHISVVGELRWKDLRNVVLVGHSYGGMVITGVAEREFARIGTIVYLDAFLPKSGQSLNDIVGFASGNGADPVSPLCAAESMMVNPADRAWVSSKMTPQSAETFSQKLNHTGECYRVPKKVYSRPIDFPSPFSDAVCAPLRKDPTWRVVDNRKSGHDVMIDQPSKLAQSLGDGVGCQP